MVVTEVIKIKNYYIHLIKVTWQEANMVERALDKGLLIFNTTILPEQISRAELISFLTCFNCYIYE